MATANDKTLISILAAPDSRKDQLLLALCTSCGEIANPCLLGTETLRD